MEISKIILSFATPFLLATLIYKLVAGSQKYTLAKPIFFLLTSQIAMGIVSLIFFLWLLLFSGQFPYLFFEMVVVLILVIVWSLILRGCVCGGDLTKNPIIGLKKINKVIYPIAFCIILIYLYFAVGQLIKYPHGNADGWVLWNSKARFIFRDPQNWQKTFSTLVFDRLHPDYPPFLPLLVARGWFYLGKETLLYPAIVALWFSISAIALIFFGLCLGKNLSVALIGTLLLIGTPLFIINGVSMGADMPLSTYYLSSFILITFVNRELDASTRKISLMLAGQLAAFSAWMKNEGILFLFILSFFWFFKVKKIKLFLVYIFGTMVIISFIVLFKMISATENDIFSLANIAGNIGRIADISRYKVIYHVLLLQFSRFGDWTVSPIYFLILYLILFKLRDKHKWRFLSVVAILCGYLLSYLLTPLNLQWHLDTSLNRLLLQLWPSFIFLYLV